MSQLLLIIFAKTTAFISSLGYWGIGICMAIESCNIPLPSELILPFGGYLVSTGKLTFAGAVLAGTVGGTFGSVVSYYIGLLGGRPFLYRYGRFFGVTPKKLALADDLTRRYGDLVVFITRLLPIIRTFISLVAGTGRMRLGPFIIYTFLGTLPWSIALTYAGYLLGSNWEAVKPWFHRLDLLVVTAIAAVIIYFWLRRHRSR